MNRTRPSPQGARGLAGETGIYNHYSDMIAAGGGVCGWCRGDPEQEAFTGLGAGGGVSGKPSEAGSSRAGRGGAKALSGRT